MAKPRNPDKYYFDQAEEDAIKAYNSAKTDAEREKIFREQLHKPLSKLVECVLRRFKYTYWINIAGEKEPINDLLTHAVSVLPFVDNDKGKAFSYISLCVKRYAIQKNKAIIEETGKQMSINQTFNEDTDLVPELIYDEEQKNHNQTDFFKIFLKYMKKNKVLMCYNERDKVVFDAIIELMEDIDNVEFIFAPTSVRQKGKHVIWTELKKRSGLKTFEMDGAIQRFKKTYQRIAKKYINGEPIEL